MTQINKAAILVLILSLGGCTASGSVQGLEPVCEALGPPIVYNSKNKNSDYHAGPKLAPRLATQNGVGENLPCPGY